MEALILMIIFGLISSFFGKKDERKKSKPMPPFNNPTAPSKPAQQKTERPKSLEDFANEIFGQLNEKKAEREPVPVEVQAPIFEPVVKSARPTERQASTRPPLQERPLVKKLKQEPAFQVVPKNQKQVMQAIVMAEVLGKPKAKR